METNQSSQSLAGQLPGLVIRTVFLFVRKDFANTTSYLCTGYTLYSRDWLSEIKPFLGVCQSWRRIAIPIYYKYAYSIYTSTQCKEEKPYKSGFPSVESLVAAGKSDFIEYVRLLFNVDVLSRGTIPSILSGPCYLGKPLERVRHITIIFDNINDAGLAVADTFLDTESVWRNRTRLAASYQPSLGSDIILKIEQAVTHLRMLFPNYISVDFSTMFGIGDLDIVAAFGACLQQYSKHLYFRANTYGNNSLLFLKNWSKLTRLIIQTENNASILKALVATNVDTLEYLKFLNVDGQIARYILASGLDRPAKFSSLKELHVVAHKSGYIGTPSEIQQRLGQAEPQITFPLIEVFNCPFASPNLACNVLSAYCISENLVKLCFKLNTREFESLYESRFFEYNHYPCLRFLEIAYDKPLSLLEAPSEPREALVLSLVDWATRVGQRCCWLKLCGWRQLGVRTGVGEQVVQTMVESHNVYLRHLEIPVTFSMANALRLIEWHPHLVYLALSLDDFQLPSEYPAVGPKFGQHIAELKVTVRASALGQERTCFALLLLLSLLPVLKEVLLKVIVEYESGTVFNQTAHSTQTLGFVRLFDSCKIKFPFTPINPNFGTIKPVFGYIC